MCEFAACDRIWSVAQTLNSSLVTLACDETVFHSMVHFWVHILKGSSAEYKTSEYYSVTFFALALMFKEIL